VVGIPATHRDHASSLTVVTGHEDPTKADSALDWDALAASVSAGGTLVILMGVGCLPDNAAALRAGGVDPETPVAMVERASRDDEFTVTGTLDTIVDRAREVGIDPPAVTVVGDVVSVRDRVSEYLRAAGTARSAGGVEKPPVPTDPADCK
jgi:uroporphyrin-III C-methyltransferase